jgi:hypothetical protein
MRFHLNRRGGNGPMLMYHNIEGDGVYICYKASLPYLTRFLSSFEPPCCFPSLKHVDHVRDLPEPITTEGHKAYLYAMNAGFGGEADYAHGAAPESAKGRYSNWPTTPCPPC